MWLFRTPRDNIKKWIKREDYLALAAVETWATLQLNDLSRLQKEFAVGVILSLWACNSAVSGNVSLLATFPYLNRTTGSSRTWEQTVLIGCQAIIKTEWSTL